MPRIGGVLVEPQLQLIAEPLQWVKSFQPATDDSCGPESDMEYAKVLLALPEQLSS